MIGTGHKFEEKEINFITSWIIGSYVRNNYTEFYCVFYAFKRERMHSDSRYKTKQISDTFVYFCSDDQIVSECCIVSLFCLFTFSRQVQTEIFRVQRGFSGHRDFSAKQRSWRRFNRWSLFVHKTNTTTATESPSVSVACFGKQRRSNALVSVWVCVSARPSEARRDFYIFI